MHETMMKIVDGAKRALKPPLYSLERQLYLSGVLSLKNLSLPHFLVLGSSQSGTTWLHKALVTHPNVFLPQKKETHYFSRAFDEWPLSYYASLFSGGKSKTRGEITPGYNLLRQDRIKFISRIMPDVRLVLIIRNPIDRSWSEARRSMGKVAKSMGINLDQLDDSRFYDYFEKEWTYVPEYGGYFEPGLRQGQYSRTIDNWLFFFPKEQFHVCFFDQIAEDPRGFLRSICQHIGVDPDFEWDPELLHSVVNRNPELRMPDRFRRFLEQRYCTEIDELHKSFGEPVNGWLCSVRDQNMSQG